MPNQLATNSKGKMYGVPKRTQVRPCGGGSAAELLLEVVRLASTANVNPTGAATLDGSAVATDDLVLLRLQSVAGDRGVWKVNTSGPWQFIGQYKFVPVRSGTISGGCSYFLSTTNTYTGLGAFWK